MSQSQSEGTVPGSGDWPAFDEGDVYRRLVRMTEQGEQGVLATIIATRLSVPRHAGTKMIVHADGSVTGTVGGGAAEALIISRAAEVIESGDCQTVAVNLAGEHGVCGGAMDVFLEPVQHAIPFIVVGAGHVGRAIAGVGRALGFRFTLVDDRPEFLAAAESLSGVRMITAGPADLASRLTVPGRAAVLVCSRNHQLDAEYLEALLRMEKSSGREFLFFGALGSRNKATRIRATIGAKPELAARMDQVRLPVGLDIGAESPVEIALSILTEALAVLRGAPFVIGPDGARACPLKGDKL